MTKKKKETLKDKNFKHGGKWYMVYCPKCDLENYAPAVASGTCAWCGLNLNEEIKDLRDERNNPSSLDSK